MPTLPIARRGDALLIVPPFAAIDLPALGPHAVQASARAAGFEVAILYANLWFAAEIGELDYQAIAQANRKILLGERFFAPLAFGGRDHELLLEQAFARCGSMIVPPLDQARLRTLMARAGPWLDALLECLDELDYPVIGCSTTFEQTAASLAILSRAKRRRPERVSVLGGANCEGEMAAGLLSLQAGIDHVFAGESEASFTEFLGSLRAGRRPPGATVSGRPCREMDALPTPDFTEFYRQYDRFLPAGAFKADGNLWLPYESSRGCWWGQKHHCTFCGLSDEAIGFRAKSPDRVLAEWRTLLEAHPTNKLCAVDYIMPQRYFRDLLPRVPEELPPLHAFFFVKANLGLAQVRALAAAGAAVVQPGIEALDTALLERMDKGVDARHNIDLLRYARACGIAVNWNLLCDLPGDELASYQRTLALLPLLHHLHPPIGVFPVRIDRFSPYFDHPQQHGLSNLRPLASYAEVFPADADLHRLAYHFDADYTSAARSQPPIVEAWNAEVAAWRAAWQEGGAAPSLVVTPLGADRYLLVDTRRLPGSSEFSFLDRRQARLALVMRVDATPSELAWARQRNLVAEVDGRCIPLATAEPELMAEFNDMDNAREWRLVPA